MSDVIYNTTRKIIPDFTIDLNEMGCGDLVIALMKAMKLLEVGQVLKVRALDPGARADIPAWCAMRGHTLIAGPCEEGGGQYYIKKGGS